MLFDYCERVHTYACVCVQTVLTICESLFCKLFLYLFTVPGPKDKDNVDEQLNFRDYYVQAEEIEWDYLPEKQNMVSFYDQ